MAPGEKDSQIGADPRKNKTLAQDLGFLGNQLAPGEEWGEEGYLKLRSLWIKLFSYSIIHQLYLRFLFLQSTNIYWKGQVSSLLTTFLTVYIHYYKAHLLLLLSFMLN